MKTRNGLWFLFLVGLLTIGSVAVIQPFPAEEAAVATCLTATQVILYFDSIAAGDTVTLRFRLRAKYPVRREPSNRACTNTTTRR